MERWMSVIEIASHLGISKETIYRWLELQKIPGHKIGRLWKFRASEVDAWVLAGGAKDDEQDNFKIKPKTVSLTVEQTK